VTRYSTWNVLAGVTAASLFLASCGEDPSIMAGADSDGAGFEIKDSDRVLGSPDAPVTIIEYASMTCSHCAAFATTVLPELEQEYIDSGQVRFVFREFPLDGVARVASALARCQTGDNYFAFIDLIFENQQNWLNGLFAGGGQDLTQEKVEESLIEYARISGLGREQAIACMRDTENLAEVDANWEEAQNRYNIHSTPGFVVNGTTHSGALPFDSFKEIIDPLLEGN
jgi:protein-disulfide isomerase